MWVCKGHCALKCSNARISFSSQCFLSRWNTEQMKSRPKYIFSLLLSASILLLKQVKRIRFEQSLVKKNSSEPVSFNNALDDGVKPICHIMSPSRVHSHHWWDGGTQKALPPGNLGVWLLTLEESASATVNCRLSWPSTLNTWITEFSFFVLG